MPGWGWYREPGAGSPGHRGRCRPGADNAAPCRGTAAVRPGAGSAPGPQVSRWLRGAPPTSPEGHRGGRSRRASLGLEGRATSKCQPLNSGAPAGSGCRTREGERDLFGQSRARHPRRRNPARREAGRGAGPRGNRLTPVRPPARQAAPCSRPGPGAETCSSPAAEPKARCPGQEGDQLTGQLLRAFRGHHPWKDLENFIPFLSLGPQEHRTGTEDCPNGWLD